MDLIFELIIECMIGLITDDGVDIVTGSDRTKGWSKGFKIFIVAAALLIILAIVGLLLLLGIYFWSEGDMSAGIPLTIAGAALLIFSVFKFVMAYRKNISSKKERRK
jgi:threonine/homoserine/homoserine lactone efflux protein